MVLTNNESVLKELNELLKCPQSQVMDLGGGLPGDALGKVGKLKRARGVCRSWANHD